MHVRLSTLKGLPVVIEENPQATIAQLQRPVIDLSTGEILGYIVSQGWWLIQRSEYYVTIMDIVRIGTKIVIDSTDALIDPNEIIRIQTHLHDNRHLLGSDIITTQKQSLGKCADILIDTTHHLVKYLYPKTLWTWNVPVAWAAIESIKPGQIVVKTVVTIESEPANPQSLLDLELQVPKH